MRKMVFGKLKKTKRKDLSQTELEGLNDAEVLAYSLSKPDAFSEIVRRYQRLFIRKALEITRNEDDAYDVVQEAFVRMYAAGGKFKAIHAGSFKSWAYTILVRQCYSLYRKNKRLAQFSVPFDPEFVEVVADESELERHEHALSMENAMALVSKLPAKLKRMVQLYFIEGLPQKDIAAQEHLSPVAVRVRVHRAKKELKRLYMESI